MIVFLFKICISLEVTMVRNIWKNFCENSGIWLLWIIFETFERTLYYCLKVQEWPQKAENSLQPYSKILVKNHNIINVVLCQECTSQWHWRTQRIAREERLHGSSYVRIIQDDLCVKCKAWDRNGCHENDDRWYPVLSNLSNYISEHYYY